MITARLQRGGKQTNVFRDERLPSRKYDMPGGRVPSDLGDDLCDCSLLSLGLPRSIGRVAPCAAQIASACAYEYRRYACQLALALQRVEDFGNQHSASYRDWCSSEEENGTDTSSDQQCRPARTPPVVPRKYRICRTGAPRLYNTTRCVRNRRRVARLW